MLPRHRDGLLPSAELLHDLQALGDVRATQSLEEVRVGRSRERDRVPNEQLVDSGRWRYERDIGGSHAAGGEEYSGGSTTGGTFETGALASSPRRAASLVVRVRDPLLDGRQRLGHGRWRGDTGCSVKRGVARGYPRPPHTFAWR